MRTSCGSVGGCLSTSICHELSPSVVCEYIQEIQSLCWEAGDFDVNSLSHWDALGVTISQPLQIISSLLSLSSGKWTHLQWLVWFTSCAGGKAWGTAVRGYLGKG